VVKALKRLSGVVGLQAAEAELMLFLTPKVP
jgi:hypothetical protein